MKEIIKKTKDLSFEIVEENEEVIKMERTIYSGDIEATQTLEINVVSKEINYDDVGIKDELTVRTLRELGWQHEKTT